MARWPRTSAPSSVSSSGTTASTSAARSSSWLWWWLLPLPVASAFKRLLLRLMALWLNSPLRRLRIGSRPVFLRLGGGEDDDDGDREMRSYEDNEEEGDEYYRLPESASLLALNNNHATPAATDAVGLVNVGNTCFVNAILQCLAVLPAFHASIQQEVEVLHELQSEREDVGGDDRSREKQRLRLHTAKTLLELLKSLTPASSALSNGGSARDGADDEDGETAYDSRGASVKRRRRNGHARSNGGVKKPVRHVDRETVTAQVRAFLEATRECTDLVSGEREQQEQQDAEEFLSFLLELLHELLLPVRCSSAAPSISSLPPLNPQEQDYFRQGEEFFARELKKCKPLDPRSYTDVVSGLGDLRWQRFLKQNNSVVTDLFVGQIVRGSQCCSCANLTCLHQELRVLSLTVNANASFQSLVSCLEAHRHAEHLVDENRVFCEGYCHMKTSRITQVLFQRAPPVLVIQLQRFKQSSGWGLQQLEKIGTPVSFPSDDLLDITENMFVRNEAQHVIYKLVAVCAHLGNSIDSGHYVAYVNQQQQDRESAAQWLRMDDDVVTAIDEDTFREETLSSAYILFYTRISS